MNAAVEASMLENTIVVHYEDLVNPAEQEETLHMLAYNLNIAPDFNADLIKGDHNTWEMYSPQLSDGALEVIRRTVRERWDAFYAEYFGYPAGGFEEPVIEEAS